MNVIKAMMKTKMKKMKIMSDNIFTLTKTLNNTKKFLKISPKSEISTFHVHLNLHLLEIVYIDSACLSVAPICNKYQVCQMRITMVRLMMVDDYLGKVPHA